MPTCKRCRKSVKRKPPAGNGSEGQGDVPSGDLPMIVNTDRSEDRLCSALL